jgi:AcrR family transcriptional regulator
MEKNSPDLSTEEKIKEAARRIFTKKGYSATRTRDIAEAAGINLALLNYYFRSKEKLFDIVMLENFGQFVSGIRVLLNEKNSTLEQKLENLVEHYINQLNANPDLPLFVLNEIRADPKKLKARGFTKDMLLKSHFMQQIVEELKKRKKTGLNPLHLVMNLFSMTIFPFLAAPLISEVGNLAENDFKRIMEERKKYIPVWITMMLSTS